MDAKEYRQQVQEQLRKGRESQPRYKNVNEGVDLSDDQLEAIHQAEEVEIRQGVEADLPVLTGSQNPAELRVAALSRLICDGRNDARVIDAVFKIVADPAEPPQLRLAALAGIKQLRFSSALISQENARMIETLRSVIDDPILEIRTFALDMLAKLKDPVAQQRLLNSLKQQKEDLLPLHKTIQLLGYDIHTDIYPVLREILQKSTNTDAQYEAVRVLSSDPSSANVLADAYGKQDKDQMVRTASAAALQSLNPGLYEKVAKGIALDANENETLRAVSIKGLERNANPASIAQDKAFNADLEKVLQQTPSKPIQKAVRQYQNKIPIE
jgi:hypothetical protein